MGIMAMLWALNNSPTVSPALSPTHLHQDQLPVAGGGEDLLSDMFWSVVLGLLRMWNTQPELDTVRAVEDAPEEVSVDLDEAMLLPEAEEWLLEEPPWTRRPEEMSTELLDILQMIPKDVTTKAVPREVSIDHPEKRNKEKLQEVYRGWTLLRLIGCDDTLLQTDEGPLHHGHGSLADEDVEALLSSAKIPPG